MEYSYWKLVLYRPVAPSLLPDNWLTLPIFCKNREPLLEVIQGLMEFSPYHWQYDLYKVDGVSND